MSASRKAGYYWVKYVSRDDWSIEYWNGGMWFTRNPHLVDDSMFSTIDETAIVREGNVSKKESNCNKPAVINNEALASSEGVAVCDHDYVHVATVSGHDFYQCSKCGEGG